MKRMVLMVLLLPAIASAQSSFDGTWKVDLGKGTFTDKPD